jgi:hypothetical protein
LAAAIRTASRPPLHRRRPYVPIMAVAVTDAAALTSGMKVTITAIKTANRAMTATRIFAN